jgi:hypothetical protein
MSDNTPTKGMSEAFSNFRNFVSENPENHVDLISMLKAPIPVNESIIEYAEVQGFTVNKDDIDAYTIALDSGNMELNDVELNHVSGGGKCAE